MRGCIYDSTGPPVMLRTCCLAQYQTQAPAIEKTVDEKPFNELKRGFYQKEGTRHHLTLPSPSHTAQGSAAPTDNYLDQREFQRIARSQW